jgi:CTP-dependent riboflavin kinase
MLTSTIWFEDAETRLVWVTMMLLADQDGYVGASLPGLADQAKVSKEATARAVERFLAPDPESRSQEFEGRRIEKVDRGWRLLNHGKFREARALDARREQTREATRRYRQRGRGNKV